MLLQDQSFTRNNHKTNLPQELQLIKVVDSVYGNIFNYNSRKST